MVEIKKYTLDDNGILTIKGDIDLTNFSNNFKEEEKLLIKEIILPSNLKTIAYFAFTDCKSLEKITIPNSVKKIDEGAFSGCRNLQDIKLPGTLEYLGDFVFSDCDNLEKVYLPNSIKYLSNYAFFVCKNLKEIHISKDAKINKDFYDTYKEKIIYLEEEEKEKKMVEIIKQNLDQVQEGFKDRLKEDFDYYDDESPICIIHAKFGHLRKACFGLSVENGLTQEFVDEFDKYWDMKPSIFKKETDILDYVVKHQLPVIFYDNYNDLEMSLNLAYRYFNIHDIEEKKQWTKDLFEYNHPYVNQFVFQKTTGQKSQYNFTSFNKLLRFEDNLSPGEILIKISSNEAKEIKDNVLRYCNDLEFLSLDNVEEIGNNFLQYNQSLIFLNLPKVKKIGDNFLENHPKRDLFIKQLNLTQNKNQDIIEAFVNDIKPKEQKTINLTQHNILEEDKEKQR